MGENFFTVRLSASEYKHLAELAESSGRSKGSVVKRLLTLADLPEAKKLLGWDAKHSELAHNEGKR